MPYLRCTRGQFYYEESGTGKSSLLFLHGTAGNHNYLRSQFEFFRKDYRVVSLDLRGHGSSVSLDSFVTIEAFSIDILHVVEALNLRQVTVVGHSLGGMIGLDFSLRSPDLFDRLIILDTPIFVPSSVVEKLQNLSIAFQGPSYLESVRDFAVQFFFTEATNPSLKESILKDLLSFPQSSFTAIWNALAVYDPRAAVLACKKPLLYILGSAPSDLNYFRELNSKLQVGQTVGAGHFHQLEVPHQINWMIQRFLEVTPYYDTVSHGPLAH